MSIDPLRDGNIKNKMGIIGYTDRRLRDYKYNPEIIPNNINISYHPLPPPPNNPPNIPKPTSNKDNNNNNNKKNAAIGLIFIVIVIFIVIANIVNFYLNMQDVKYFQDRVNEEQQKVNELTPPSSTGTTTVTTK